LLDQADVTTRYVMLNRDLFKYVSGDSVDLKNTRVTDC
jgi:hypothetical protein